MFASVGLLDEVRAGLDQLNGTDFCAQSAAETERLVHDLRAVQAQLAAVEARRRRGSSSSTVSGRARVL